MPKGRTTRCDDCGVFPRRIETPTGETQLCLNCNDDPVIAAVSDIRERLGLDPRDETCAYAFGIAEAVRDTHATTSRNPNVIAAAALYIGSIIADEKLTQTALADAADTGTTTIRQCYGDLYEASGFEDAYGPIEAGELNPDRPNPVFDLEGWRDHLEEGAAATTVKATVSDVRRFATWYDGDDPTADDVSDWLADLAAEGYAPSTIEGRYASVRKYFEWAGLETFGASDVGLNDHLTEAWQQKA